MVGILFGLWITWMFVLAMAAKTNGELAVLILPSWIPVILLLILLFREGDDKHG